MTGSTGDGIELFVYLPEPLYLALRERAELADATLAEVVREALAGHLAAPIKPASAPAATAAAR